MSTKDDGCFFKSGADRIQLGHGENVKNIKHRATFPYVFDGIILKVKLLLRQLGNDPNIIYKKPSKKERRAFKKYLENNVSSQVCPGTAIEIGEEEEEGEREEKDE
uniref:Uncharacterized protein n=1 Tax=Rhodnius prolixus TaxID=13249 RepID=T1IFA1_RHOPR